MHEHTRRFGVPVRGVRKGAPCGPRAEEDSSFARAMSSRVGGFMPIGGGAPVATESELTDLRKEITRLENEAAADRAKADQRVAEIRDADTDPLKDKAAFDEIDALYRVGDDKLQEASDLRERADRAMQILGKDKPAPRTAGGDDGSPKDGDVLRRMAQNFIDSPAYARVKDLVGIDLRAASAHLRDNPTEVLTREELEVMLRAVTIPASPSALTPADFRSPVLGRPAPTRILDLITVGQTGSDLVQFVREVLTATAAAETAEGDPATPGTGLLPESDFEFQPDETGVKRIGHWTPVRESQLADASQLETVLKTRLREGVLRRTENQVISGDAAGENLRGILNTSGIGSVLHQDAGPPSFAGENVLDTIHRSITTCRLAEVEPNGVAMHPVGYEQGVVLLKDDHGNYLFKIGEPASVWGKPVAVTTAVDEDTALVGAFEHANLLIRTALQVLASNEHADFFLRGLVALKAEYRAAFYVDRPAAFCAVTGI